MLITDACQSQCRSFNLSVVISLKTKHKVGLPRTLESKIQTAINILVNQHDVLRTTIHSCFADDDDMASLVGTQSDDNVQSSHLQVAQRLNCLNDLTVYVVKHSPLVRCSRCTDEMSSPVSEMRCISCAVHEEIFVPFDLSQQMFRCTIFTHSDQEMVVCLVFHHLIVDGMSLFMLTSKLLSLLNDHSDSHVTQSLEMTATHSNVRPTLPTQLEGADEPTAMRKKRIERWVALLSSAERCLDLWSGHHGKHVPTSDHPDTAGDIFLELSQESSKSISYLSQTYHISPAVVLATMYSLTLYHFTGVTDIIIGTVSANRSRATANAVGYFANTLPLRVNLSSLNATSLQMLLKDVRKNWSMILAGRVDLADLIPVVPCLQHNITGRKLQSSPLQVLFSFFDVGEGKSLPNKVIIDGVDVGCNVEAPKPGHTHTDLCMEANPNKLNENGKQVFHWEYRKSVLTSSMVESLHLMLCRYLKVAADVAVIDEKSVNPLQLHIQMSSLSMSQVEGNYLFRNEKGQDTAHLCYIQRFERKAQECLQSPAFKLNNGLIYTYGDVLNMIAAVALCLIKTFKVKPGDRVAILLPRDVNLYLVVLGVLKCGAAYVPVTADSTHPGAEDRVSMNLKATEAKLLLTLKSLWRTAPRKISNVAYLDELIANLHNHKSLNFSKVDLATLAKLEASYSPELLFYILFTSGTTGDPKAVGITNANLDTTFNNFLSLLSPEETELTLAATGINFDSHIVDSFSPLLNGACLVIAESALDLVESSDFNNDSGIGMSTSESSSSPYQGITFAFATPSTASIVDYPSSMKAIMVGGEVFTRACYLKTKHIPKVLNIYGPTECSVFITATEVPKLPSSVDTLSNEEISCIGWPLPSVKVLIMNDAKKVVPLGRVGELHIAGQQVSCTGYLNADKENKLSFFPNPSNPEETVYATGDLMYMLPNHMLQFVGRKHGQVKLRGMWIQLQEVTDTLTSHPDVKYATSLVINPSTPSATVVSFVSPKKVNKLSLLEHARKLLPSHMVPSLIITDNELIGYKLSRDYIQCRALKALEEEMASQGQDVSTEDPIILNTASNIAALFGKVLNMQEYPIEGDFFTFGGHSLLSFQLLKEINLGMGVRLSLAHIMQNPTPMGLADVVIEFKANKELHQSQPSNLYTCTEVSTNNPKYVDQVSPAKMVAHRSTTSPDVFDYLEPVPTLPLTAELEEKLFQLWGYDKSEGNMSLLNISNTLAQETGFYIPPSSLFHYHGSMKLLQAHLKLKTVLSFTSHSQNIAVTLHPPSTSVDKPVFFIHGGIIGWSLSYVTLARRIGAYSITIQRTPEAPTSSFEEMVAFYLKEMLSIQFEGPYRLVGVCYGAYIVYEMMRQLADMGKRVGLAVLINNSPVNENRPIVFNKQGKPLPNTMSHPIYFFENTLKLRLGEDNELMEKHNDVDVDIGNLTANLLKIYPWLPFSASELAEAYTEFIKTLKPAWFGYIPKPVSQVELVRQILLIRNKEHPLFESHDYGICDLVKNSGTLEVIVSPKKLGLLNDEQTVNFIADEIKRYLIL